MKRLANVVLFILLSLLISGCFTEGKRESSSKLEFQPAFSQVDPTTNSRFTCNVMAPLHLMTIQRPNDSNLSYEYPNQTTWNTFRGYLQTLKGMGVEAVSVDVWWSDIEPTDDNFRWVYYDDLFQMIVDEGLDIVVILSFHECKAGNNPGDNYNAILPYWIWEIADRPGNSAITQDDMKYKNEIGGLNVEYVSLWADDYVKDEYIEVMNAFENQYASFAGDILEINISGGPAGELRYPSYDKQAGWQWPDRGFLQAYGDLAQDDFRAKMTAKYSNNINQLNTSWNTSYTSFSQVYVPYASEVFSNGNYRDSSNNKIMDFVDWYNASLVAHGERLISYAEQAFGDPGSPFLNIEYGMKIPGIHWRITDNQNPRTAELAAGLITTRNGYDTAASGYGYNSMLDTFVGTPRQTNLHFTCLEKDNQDWENGEYIASGAKDLVFWVAKAADAKGVVVKGENALNGGLYSDTGWNLIDNALDWAPYSGITILRMTDVLTGLPHNRYKQIIAKYAERPDTMYIRSDFDTGQTGWEKIKMNEVSGSWMLDVTFTSNSEYKFDKYGDWTDSYGDGNSDGYLDKDPNNNISITAGEYTISIDKTSMQYTVTPKNPLLPPANFVVANEHSAMVSLNWDSVAGATSYELERDGQIISFHDIGVGGVDDDLEPSTSYQYRVRAKKNSQVSAWSNAVTAQTDAASLPAPINFAVTGNQADITVDFTSPTGYDHTGDYEILRSESQSGTYTTIADLPCQHGSNNYSFADTSASSGVTYYYKARMIVEQTPSQYIQDKGVYTAIESGQRSGGTYLKNFPALYLRGTNNAWQRTEMELVADNTWRVTVDFNATSDNPLRFKFTTTLDWSDNWGDGDQNNVLDKLPNNDIFIPNNQTGNYTITVYDDTNAYTIHKNGGSYSSYFSQVDLRGTFNSWGTEPMVLIADYTWQATITFTDVVGQTERFKFDMNGQDWGYNFGDDKPYNMVIDQNGDDIDVLENTTYVVTLNSNASGSNVTYTLVQQ
jgi:beta-amylase